MNFGSCYLNLILQVDCVNHCQNLHGSGYTFHNFSQVSQIHAKRSRNVFSTFFHVVFLRRLYTAEKRDFRKRRTSSTIPPLCTLLPMALCDFVTSYSLRTCTSAIYIGEQKLLVPVSSADKLAVRGWCVSVCPMPLFLAYKTCLM